MDREIWRPVVGYEGLYEVSNFGRVRSLDRYVTVGSNSKKLIKGVILKPSSSKRGYLHVILSAKGNKKSCSLHRLVAQSFIGKIGSRFCVNHINGIKTDNRIENLEICTQRENVRHAFDKKLSICGEKHSKAKLSDEQVKQIRCEYIPYSKEYSYAALAKKYGVNPHTIYLTVKNKIRTRTK